MKKCNCGNMMTPTYRFSVSGTDRLYKCKKCGMEIAIITIKRKTNAK